MIARPWQSFRIPFPAVLGLVYLFLFLPLGCDLGGVDEPEHTFSFPTLADSLKGSDSALIILKDAQGRVLDTLYTGPVTGVAFVNLPAPHYQGGKVKIEVEGRRDGVVVFRMEKLYSGRSGFTDSTIVLISNPVGSRRADSVVISPDSLILRVRGASRQVRAEVHPDSFAQTILWASLDSSIATVSPQGIVTAHDSGIARIVATSTSDKARADTLRIHVLPHLPVERISFDPAHVEVFVEGSTAAFKVTVLPEGSNPALIWTLAESTLVEIKDGNVRGLKTGEAMLTARSLEDTGLFAELRIRILPKPPDPVDSVAVSPDSLRLYTGGENLQLSAAIHPTSHSPRFRWHSGTPSFATVDSLGWVKPVSPGRLYVRARSAVDSTKADSALIVVRKDVPQISIGKDTAVSIGSTVSFSPQVTQEYGQITKVRWDLDGDGTWDDSAKAFKLVQQTFPVAGEFTVRFYALDGEGNDTVAIKRVRIVDGPVILFHSPSDSAHVNKNPITVTWSVNSVMQTGVETLEIGPNILTRTATNSVGDTFSASITIHLDTTPPARPLVMGPPSPTAGLRPAWKWEGTGGGNGTYRYRLNIDNLASGAALGTDTAFTLAGNLTGGTHILYVQEQDLAGNWSTSGSFAVRIDTTKPSIPTITLVPLSPTNDRRPVWTWTQTEAGAGFFRFSLDDAAFRDTTSSSFRPGLDLSEGSHTVRVQARDSAGNMSDIASSTVVIDITGPDLPVFKDTPRSPTSSLRPTWSWSSGGGGSGNRFRFSLNDAPFRDTSATSFQPGDNLPEGIHTLRVQEIDAAGNYSEIVNRTITVSARGYLGTPGQNVNRVSNISLGMNGGAIYSAFIQGELLKVRSYASGTWQDIGSNLYSDSVLNVHMNINNSGIPYVLFSEYSGGQMTVMRLIGGMWSNVGTPRFTMESGFLPIIQFNPSNVPYALFIETVTKTMRIFRLDGQWNAHNLDGFPNESILDYSFAFQKNGDPILAFTNFGESLVYVMRYSSSRQVWENVGDMVELNKLAFDIELIVNQNDEPLIAFNDERTKRISVLKLIGSRWIDYGNIGMPPAIGEVGLTLGVNQNPIIGFGNSDEGGRLSIMTVENSAWHFIGPTSLSDGQLTNITMRVNAGGVPYAAFNDNVNSYGISVYKTSYDP